MTEATEISELLPKETALEVYSKPSGLEPPRRDRQLGVQGSQGQDRPGRYGQTVGGRPEGRAEADRRRAQAHARHAGHPG
ncbi:hypothetical protein G6F32_017058 [Rhizopus arrhizus]|nr:hypothetical protein G6F32_017058 [Rhizopus arrhizus]